MTSLFNIITDAIDSLIDSKQPQGYTAIFGKETDIASRFNKGFLISKHRKLTRKKSFENVLIAGPTGCGKTTRILLKNLFELKNCSMVINDPSKELYMLASGYLSQYFEIKTLNFSDSSKSSGFNILSRIKRENDIHKIANILVASTLEKGSSGDPFWAIQCRALIVLLITIIRFQPKEYQNMAGVLYLLKLFSVKQKYVDGLVLQTQDKQLILEYKSLISCPEKTLQNIIATAKASLQIFSDTEIAKVTSTDTISFESIREKPTVLFLHNSIADTRYNATLVSLLFEQLLQYILSEQPKKHHKDLFLIIEEASSLYIPILPIAVANCRKTRTSTIIAIQNENQLETMYHKDAQNIVANCITKLYMPGITSPATLKELETLSGKMTYRDEKNNEKIKSLITADEIRLLEENKSLIISGNNPYIIGRTSPYFHSFIYSRRAAIPPVPFYSDIPDEPLKLIGDIP